MILCDYECVILYVRIKCVCIYIDGHAPAPCSSIIPLISRINVPLENPVSTYWSDYFF